jgi:putative endonuclease
MTTKQKLGAIGEAAAADYLVGKGWTVLEQNYHFEKSEVDLVAYDGFCIVFVEVKTRKTADFGYPDEGLSDAQLRRVQKAGAAWIYERKMDPSPTRVDLIGIVMDPGSDLPPVIEHLEGVDR